MKDKPLEKIADEARKSGDHQLAIVLYTFLGSRKAGLTKEFADYCQDWAKAGVEWIELHKKIEKIKKN
tara:strand:- start:437 stop:640 length:204 start_codon:yes stop_codon:yes gene_type:complete